MSSSSHIRFITAAALFDGHDVSINVIRRVLQKEGVEVIHLGHNRSVHSVVKAAIEEDVHGIAISSYQGGHIEYFTYMLDLLRAEGAQDISLFGGGGGVIIPEEIALLESRGVKKIYSPDDGLKLGLEGMIKDMMARVTLDTSKNRQNSSTLYSIAHNISLIEEGLSPHFDNQSKKKPRALTLGITGTGGAGKSSLIDELIVRFLRVFRQKKIAILSVDPSKSRSQGALLGDRIRMNSADDARVFMRSMATRRPNAALSQSTAHVLSYLSSLDFDLVILETAGTGQSNSEVRELSDASLYVMTPEYGSPSQLEKIDMLDYADLVAINKFDKSGSHDALRDVQKALQRSREAFTENPKSMPVFGTSAHRFGDLGLNRLFNQLIKVLRKKSEGADWSFEALPEGEPAARPLIPEKRSRYLAEIADAVREHHQSVQKKAELIQQIDALESAQKILPDSREELNRHCQELHQELGHETWRELNDFIERTKAYDAGEISYKVRGKTLTVANRIESLSHLPIAKVASPKFQNRAQAYLFMGKENLPGYFPFSAGVFPFKRSGEDPTRMFAGEGCPERTNKRFHYLSHDHEAKRLSTAFDSVTLYGENPDLRPDIYGKIGNAGVSLCSLDDAKRLYSGFDLTDPKISVSLTINGPAPTILAYFLNAAIDFEVEKTLRAQGAWDKTKKAIDDYFLSHGLKRPLYRAPLPEGHNGLGLGFLGLPASLIINHNFYNNIKSYVLENIRGTVQADILKEDQAQNTCIFSTEFSLRMMGDIQDYFIKNNINNFYSVSISGYHIAEAGANPISQLAFTLANGFTLLEIYKARGMNVDDFAKNFSFFFSNGLDPEYAVIGRVARRIWAIALKNIYGANERSQKLKYHIQTSGRSLHAQEIAFNDIRTTLQALYAIADNCNSLHTNAFDEAITTPTEESVRRAVAIQLIINHELGLSKNENPWQGSYFFEEFTDQVEEAVLKSFERLNERGGVLGAMERSYQRSVIQEESLYYEHKKHSGELPLIGVNTFFAKKQAESPKLELMRSSQEEKDMQVEEVMWLKNAFKKERAESLYELKQAALNFDNAFDRLMEAAKYSSLKEISDSFFEVGGAYRRAM